jgi:uncharacterized BrkB/YihY/UPF0761 family membrane protein
MALSVDWDNQESGRPGITHWVLIGFELFVAVGAVYVGVGLIAGNAIHITDEWLVGTPFNSWVAPGILLLIVVALPMTIAAVAEKRRLSWSYRASLLAGAAQIGWIIAQWLITQRFFFLQPAMIAAGGAVLLLAWVAYGQAKSIENKAETWKR